MSYLLGIDVGTTFTAAAVHRTDSDRAIPEMITLGDHSVDMPSVVLAGEDGSLLVGDAAERRAMAEPDRVAREFKRRIGDPTPVALGAHTYSAPELAALLVRHVVETAAAREGGPADRIAVTHPASWGEHKRELLAVALADVLAAGGVTAPVQFLPEPVAAAVCYAAAERVEPGSTIAVYDLGGGTFDAAVVRKDGSPAGFTLLGRPEGLEFLGGADFDEVVFDHVRAGAGEVFDDLDETDPAVWAAVARLRRECREAKEALSADTEVAVPVWLGDRRTVVRLHRGEFEELIGPRIADTVDALHRAVASAGITTAELSSVLLVGGSSRIPLVAQLVSEGLDRPVAVDADPRNVVATGAVLALASRPSGAGRLSDDPGPLPWGVAAAGAAAGADPDEPVTALTTRPPEPATVYVTPPTEYVTPPTEYVTPVGRHTTAWTQDPPTQELPVYAGAPRAGGYPGDDVTTTLAPDTQPDRGRSPALLIGAGGVVAAVAVIGALVFWPDEQSVSNATPRLPAVPTSVAPTTTDSPPTTEDRPTRERSSEPRRTESVAPAPPPVVLPTAPVDPTTQPSTSGNPTSVPPTTTTSAVPPPRR